MFGYESALNMPIALTTTSATTESPSSRMRVHVEASSLHTALATPLPRRTCGTTSYFSAIICMYSRISGCVPYGLDQSGFISNENEYSADCTSHSHPG